MRRRHDDRRRCRRRAGGDRGGLSTPVAGRDRHTRSVSGFRLVTVARFIGNRERAQRYASPRRTYRARRHPIAIRSTPSHVPSQTSRTERSSTRAPSPLRRRKTKRYRIQRRARSRHDHARRHTGSLTLHAARRHPGDARRHVRVFGRSGRNLVGSLASGLVRTRFDDRGRRVGRYASERLGGRPKRGYECGRQRRLLLARVFFDGRRESRVYEVSLPDPQLQGATTHGAAKPSGHIANYTTTSAPFSSPGVLATAPFITIAARRELPRSQHIRVSLGGRRGRSGRTCQGDGRGLVRGGIARGILRGRYRRARRGRLFERSNGARLFHVALRWVADGDAAHDHDVQRRRV